MQSDEWETVNEETRSSLDMGTENVAVNGIRMKCQT